MTMLIADDAPDQAMHFTIASCGTTADHVKGLLKSLVLFSTPSDIIVLHAFVIDSEEARLIGNFLDDVRVFT
jgi:hypothetical protein